MTSEELQAIEARAAAATAGPWWPVNFGDEFGSACIMSEYVGITDGVHDGEVTYQHDAAFIAAARADVPALVAEVRRLTRLAEAWEKYARSCAPSAAHLHRCVSEPPCSSCAPVIAAVAAVRAAGGAP